MIAAGGDAITVVEYHYHVSVDKYRQPSGAARYTTRCGRETDMSSKMRRGAGSKSFSICYIYHLNQQLSLSRLTDSSGAVIARGGVS